MENTGFIDDENVVFLEKKRSMFFGLPMFNFTKYIITPGVITVDHGFFKKVEDDCYMYKVQDVKLTLGFFERMLRLGTITCYTGDVTSPELKLVHVRHAKEIKSYILKASEEARIKRRTINTQDIGMHGIDLDMDGIPDNID